MKGDFSRLTFDPFRHFAGVLLQQGRVQLDADSNEQAAILIHQLRTLARTIIGVHGSSGDGFRIEPADAQNIFRIHPGVYYVAGILCESEVPNRCQPDSANSSMPAITYAAQPDYPLTTEEKKAIKAGGWLAYLDVWERVITALHDPSIRESALGDGVDTAVREKVVWQVKLLSADTATGNVLTRDAAEELLAKRFPVLPRPCLKAMTKEQEKPRTPCNIPPDSAYRGAGNQLYRVEIHDGAKKIFKWSRENGSVLFPIAEVKDKLVTLKAPPKDDVLTLKTGSLVEFESEFTVLRGLRPPLRTVRNYDPETRMVEIDQDFGLNPPVTSDVHKIKLLRRWEGMGEIKDDEKPVDLEEDIQIVFRKNQAYATGDYWLIPARTTGDLEWGKDEFRPAYRPEHRYAPLSVLTLGTDGTVAGTPVDLRRTFLPLGGK